MIVTLLHINVRNFSQNEKGEKVNCHFVQSLQTYLAALQVF